MPIPLKQFVEEVPNGTSRRKSVMQHAKQQKTRVTKRSATSSTNVRLAVHQPDTSSEET